MISNNSIGLIGKIGGSKDDTLVKAASFRNLEHIIFESNLAGQIHLSNGKPRSVGYSRHFRFKNFFKRLPIKQTIHDNSVVATNKSHGITKSLSVEKDFMDCEKIKPRQGFEP